MNAYTRPELLELGSMARVTRKTGPYGDPGETGSAALDDLPAFLQFFCTHPPLDLLFPNICNPGGG